MDVVETMMGDCHRHDLLGRTHPAKFEAACEVVHEPSDVASRGRVMATNGHILRRLAAEFAGHQLEAPAVARFHLPHRPRKIPVEVAVNLLHELARRRFIELALGEQGVYLPLDADVRARFDLKVSATASVQIIDQRSLDVARPGVVALDQVAVVAVHDRNELRQASCRTGVKPRTQGARALDQFDDGVCQGWGEAIELAGLDSRW
jgi:hypothetical protein